MRPYELTYLISDNVPENELNKVTGKVGGYIKDSGGEVLKEEIWGRRKLAYPIKKLEFATYVTINFNLPSDKAKEFEHNIVMTGKIVRHLITVKDFGTEELTLTAEDIAETEDIKEVIGGEKSFEVVEGETEESKDLMAVRETAPEMDPKPEQARFRASDELNEPRKIDIEQEEEIKDQKRIADVTDEEKEPQKTEKPVKEKKAKAVPPKKTKEDEADRLSKLDKELDDILGEEL